MSIIPFLTLIRTCIVSGRSKHICWLLVYFPESSTKYNEQAGAELCQAQAQVGLTAEAELILVLSSMAAVFHLSKIVLDSTKVDLQIFG
jgi:hypothetical protein